MNFLDANPIASDTIIIGGQETGQQQTESTVQVGGAQGAAAAPPPAGLNFITIGIWVAMFVGLYFLILRPQRKREKAVREMQSGIKVSDNIVTTAGFFGKVVGVGTDAFLIEFGEGRGTRIWVRKSDISGIKTPTMTPPPAQSTGE